MKTKPILQLIFNILISCSVIIGLIAIALKERNFLEQFWYFTIQSNVFVLIISVFRIFDAIKIIQNKPSKVTNSKAFKLIHLVVAFYITITCIIYCFVLFPVMLNSKQTTLIGFFNTQNLLHHLVVPILEVVDCFVLSKPGKARFIQSLYFLLYPTLYFTAVNLRVVFGGKTLFGGSSYYPYFFIDPNHNNQGWGMVILFSLCMFALICILSIVYVAIDKAILRRQEKKLLATQTDTTKTD